MKVLVYFINLYLANFLSVATVHKQRRRHEESRGCGSKLHDRDMETAKVSEAIYDQICDRASVNSEVVKNEQYIHYQYHK